MPVADITVVVHPQSVVHSMVEFVDGSALAQASPPDMRLPIALGLSWPDRVPDVAPPCDWTQATAWTFEPLDEGVFGAVRLARQAVAASATHPAVYNAANEECVEAFLAGRIGFPGHREHGRAVLASTTAPRRRPHAGRGAGGRGLGTRSGAGAPWRARESVPEHLLEQPAPAARVTCAGLGPVRPRRRPACRGDAAQRKGSGSTRGSGGPPTAAGQVGVRPGDQVGQRAAARLVSATPSPT